MHKELIISVITVSFNSVKTIEQTIQSVLNQTYPNVEYIIIDGGSTDGTVNIIQKYSNKLTYWVSEPDHGIYDAMNKGLKKATGVLVGIINSDDFYDVSTIERIVETYKMTDGDIYHGNLMIINQNGQFLQQLTPPSDLKQIWHTMVCYHPTCFVKREVYLKLGGYNTSFRLASDYDFLLRCYLEKAAFCYINSPLAYFRIGGASMQHAYCSISETRDIAILHGYRRWLAYGWFWRNLIVYYGGIILRKLGVHKSRNTCK